MVKILLLGEGAEKKGAYKELWPLLNAIGIGNEQVTVVGLTQSGLWGEIRSCKPKIIIACGKEVASSALGREVALDRVHGLALESSRPELKGIIVVPIFHPTAAMHSPEMYTQFWLGIQSLSQILENRTSHADPYPKPCYQNASDSLQNALREAIGKPVGVDTESAPTGPLGASYSLTEGSGWWLQGKAYTPQVAVYHNAPHDLPEMEALGAEISEVVHDTMIAAHILGEPRIGLKTLAYRYCGVEMQDYTDVVAPANKKLAKQYLLRVLSLYQPEYEERVSAKTGRRLKPKKLPMGKVFKAVLRCLSRDEKGGEPGELWRKQSAEILETAKKLVGEDMSVATLEDI